MKKILVAINWVDYKNPIKKRNQDIAVDVLLKGKPKNVTIVSMNLWDDPVRQAPISLPTFKSLQKNSKKLLGNTRSLPYIKELLDLCHKVKGQYDSDIFGYINSDILLHPNFYKYFKEKSDAYYFYRHEIAETSCTDFLNGKIKYVPGGDRHPGNDAFFFSKKWWSKNHKLFPKNLVLGETEWDTCYRVILQGEDNSTLNSRALAHVYHDQKWDLSSPGAINNIEIWNRVKGKYWPPYLR